MKSPRLRNRTFGLSFAVIFIIIFLISRFVFESTIIWHLIVSSMFLMVSLIAPILLLPLNCMWDAFAHRLGGINNYLILGIVFYLAITPIGLMMRLFGRDAMERKRGSSRTTYLSDVSRKLDAENMNDLF